MEPVARSKGDRVPGDGGAVSCYFGELRQVLSHLPLQSIHQSEAAAAAWPRDLFLLRGRGQQSRRWDFPVTCDRWRRDESALHYTQVAVIIIMEKKRAVVSGVEPA